MPVADDFCPGVHVPKAYSAGLNEKNLRARFGDARLALLASNENPLGSPPGVAEAVARAAQGLHRYPPLAPEELHALLAAKLGVSPDQVVVGNGSVEVMDLIIRLVLRPAARRVLAFAPCFAPFVSRAQFAGAEVTRVPVHEDFSFPLGDLAQAVDEHTPLVYHANPDNPSGRAASGDELEQLARALPGSTLLLVDEAYIDFADDPAATSMIPRLDALPNVGVLGTLSKARGLAGARVGYAVLPPCLADNARRAMFSFTPGACARAAAEAALADDAHCAATVRMVRQGRARLFAALQHLGCDPVPSQASFILFRPPVAAQRVFEELLDRRVAVRPTAYAGLPGHLRVSVGTPQDNEMFLAALTAILKQGEEKKA